MDNNYSFTPIVDSPIILVVDDSGLVRSLIEKAFDNKYRILMASNGFDAIDIIEANANNNIVWVLLDLNMPEMGGFKVLDYFKSKDLFKKIPVTVISGDDSEETSKKVHEYSIVELLVKPFPIKSIQEGIAKAIDSVSNDN
jgi:CheY-like chemotaxis protein